MVPPGYQVLLFTALRHVLDGEPIPATLADILNLQPHQHAGLTHNAKTADVLDLFVTQASRFNATDQRDKLYAPRALAQVLCDSLATETPGVDYRAHTDSVMMEYTAYILQNNSALDLLSYARGINAASGAHTAPSWVVHLAAGSQLRGIPGMRYRTLPSWPKVCKLHRDRPHDNSIELQGVRLDTIQSIEPPLLQTYLSKDFRPLIRFCTQLLSARGSYVRITGHLWRTLIGDCDGVSFPADPSFAAAFKQWLQRITADFIQKPGPLPSLEFRPTYWQCFDDLLHAAPEARNAIPSVAELADFVKQRRSIMSDPRRLSEAHTFGLSDRYSVAAGRVYDNRSLFVSEGGILGLGPAQTVKGDQIWLLAGASVPFILRLSGNTHRLKVVGEAYVHGYMQGEFETLQPQAELQQLWLE